MKYKPYDFQQKVYEDVIKEISEGSRSVIAQLPTRAGKSIIATLLIEEFSVRQKQPVYFVGHKTILISQMSADLTENGIKHGILAPWAPQLKYRVQVISKDTLFNRYKKMKETGWKAPRLIIVDECVTGDTMITTNRGEITVSELNLKEDKYIMSSDGNRKVTSKIVRRIDSGSKKIIEIKTESKTIKCSENHLLLTETGWKSAKEILQSRVSVNVAVEKKQNQTNGDSIRYGSKDIEYGEKDQTKNGPKSIKNFLKVCLSVLADAEKRSDLWQILLRNLSQLMEFVNLAKGSRATRLDQKISITNYLKKKNQLSLERFLGTLRYYTHIVDQLDQDLYLIMEEIKRHGQDIRLENSRISISKLLKQKTRDLETSGTGVFQAVYLALKNYMTKCILIIKRISLEIFLKILIQKGLHGGIVTMDILIKNEDFFSFIQKDSLMKNRKLLKLIFLKDTELALLRREVKNTDLLGSELSLQKIYSKILANSSQKQCGIKLEKVISSKGIEDEQCFDIEVEDTHCYFSNGFISHNCHMAMGATYKEILEAYPDSIIVGLTATPIRLDMKPLSTIFDSMVIGPTIKELQSKKRLCPIETFAVDFDETGLKASRNGDYRRNDVLERVDKPAIIQDVVHWWEELAKGKKTLTFCASIKHAEDIAEEFNSRGYPSIAVSSNDGKIEIKRKLDAYYSGHYINLVSVDLFTMGFTVKECECILQCRPTSSLMIYLQSLGRGMIWMKNKVLINIDCVNNWTRHGLPEDDREWSLSGIMKKDKEISTLKKCPQCYHPVPVSSRQCPDCGYLWAETAEAGSRIPEERTGRMIRIGDNDLLLKIARNATTIEQAISIAGDYDTAMHIWTHKLKMKVDKELSTA